MTIQTRQATRRSIADTQPQSTTLITYDPEPRREWVRASITFSLIIAFLAVVGASLYSTHGEYEKMREILDKLLPAITGLIGSALGFYFGSRTQGD